MRTAALVFLSGLLMALAPQAALAHGADAHESTVLPAALPIIGQWSPACPPSPGHLCTCGNLGLCDGGAKKLLVRPAGAYLAVARPSWLAKHARLAPPPSRPSLALASPRAPPFSS
jgi:hypothetical protein